MTTDYQWRIEPHCCAYCGGRILSDAADESHVRCADCGAEDTGVKSICWCGAGEQLGDAPLTIHCAANPNKSAAKMAEIVAVEGPPPGLRSARKLTQAKR
jgi:hypothetical protein